MLDQIRKAEGCVVFLPVASTAKVWYSTSGRAECQCHGCLKRLSLCMRRSCAVHVPHTFVELYISKRTIPTIDPIYAFPAFMHTHLVDDPSTSTIRGR